MKGWLLYTNVLLELRRPKSEPKVVSLVAAQSLDRLYVSAITLAEIRFGIELVADATKPGELNDWLMHKVRPMFDQRGLPVSEDVSSNGVSWSTTAAGPDTPLRSRV